MSEIRRVNTGDAPRNVYHAGDAPRTVNTGRTVKTGSALNQDEYEAARRRAQQERGVHARAGALVLPRAEILRHADIDAVGQADEKARKQRDERRRRADGAQRRRAGEFSDNGHVRHVEQHLQQLREDQRNAEQENVFI